MQNEELKDEELPALIEFLHGRVEDIEKFMNDSYNEVLFLGATPKNEGGQLLDCVLLNLRICLYYYLSKEEYAKVGRLKKLYDIITDENVNLVNIEEDVLKSMEINLN